VIDAQHQSPTARQGFLYKTRKRPATEANHRQRDRHCFSNAESALGAATTTPQSMNNLCYRTCSRSLVQSFGSNNAHIIRSARLKRDLSFCLDDMWKDLFTRSNRRQTVKPATNTTNALSRSGPIPFRTKPTVQAHG
jgi:hypothetical protein